jgi:ERCC4-type nuclease
LSITVDTREKHINTIKDLLATSIIGPDIPIFEFNCLPLADYLLQNNDKSLLVERKNLSDFCGSYRELKPRLARMRKASERTALLLEGPYHVSQGSVWLQEGSCLKPRMRYQTMSNFLQHQQELGTRLYHTMNLEETIWRLIFLHNYLPRLDEPTPSIKAGSPAEWLVELPYLGASGVKKLQENYASPWEAIQNLPGRARQILERW